MPDFCSCGAQLPPDARFCHKCGKPQVELVPVEEPPSITPQIAVLPVAPPTPDINFKNRTAVRIGLLAAAGASLLISLPIPMYLNILWMLGCLAAAGFLAVYLYHRRTGDELSVRKGARMGWITGVFCFIIATVFYTITIVTLSRQGGLASFYREQFDAQTGAEVNLDELLEVLESPTGLAGVMFFSLLILFILSTLIPVLGGAMGAKVLEKE